MRLLAIVCVAASILSSASFAATSYHLDAETGDDGDDGASPATAWRTLSRANAQLLGPGDRLLVKAGTSYDGQLAPTGSGADGAPIVVDAYGTGARPVVAAGGAHGAALRLHNQQHIEVWNLELTNTGASTADGRMGVLVTLEDFGTASHVHLRDLYVHDVNGSGGASGGIRFENHGSSVRSRFAGLLIEGCTVVRTDSNGITSGADEEYYRIPADLHLNTGVVIRGNTLEDIGANGIVVVGCDGALVEHNRLDRGGQRTSSACCGIWPWSSNDTVIQYNEVSRMKGTLDGQAFDSDFNTRNTVIQYNYSHDNEGGFILVCAKGTSITPWNVGTVVRYNISVRDGKNTNPSVNHYDTRRGELFVVAGPVEGAKFYNNVFYVPATLTIPIDMRDWDGYPSGTEFYNNIFHIDGTLKMWVANGIDTVWDHNCFFGQVIENGVPADPHVLLADPMLAAPGTGGDGFDSLAGYRLQAGSPCIGAGKTIADDGGLDFWGGALPATGVDVGAHESGSVAPADLPDPVDPVDPDDPDDPEPPAAPDGDETLAGAASGFSCGCAPEPTAGRGAVSCAAVALAWVLARRRSRMAANARR